MHRDVVGPGASEPLRFTPLALQLRCHLPVAPQPEGPGHSGGPQLIRVKGRSTKVAEDSSNKAHGQEKSRSTYSNRYVAQLLQKKKNNSVQRRSMMFCRA